MNPELRKKQAIDASKLKRLLCYESQHQSQRNEKSLVQFDYEKAVSNYLGTQSTFNAYIQRVEGGVKVDRPRRVNDTAVDCGVQGG